jgi:hypothetical protein
MPAVDIPPIYERIECGNKIGAKTRLGSAWVSAAHLAGECGDAGGFSKLDIVVISSGFIPPTREAGIGDNVFLVGYPGGKEGEAQRGVVVLTGQSIPSRGGGSSDGLLVIMARGVGPGYSGGPAMSVDDGEVVGIILSVGPERPDGFKPVFVQPTEAIRKRMEEK